MGSRRFTRREALETAGVAALGGVLGTASSAVAGQGWVRVESPTDTSLTGVEYTDTGPYASGGSGVIIRRTDGTWETVVSDGPTGQSKTLNGAAVTDGASNGKTAQRYWVAGSSGVVGEYDPETATLYDHSKPLGVSANFTCISVVGEVNDERLYIGKGSGEVVVGHRTSDGSFDWLRTDTGSGYTVEASDFTFGEGVGYISTSGGGIYTTEDGGRSWTRLGYDDAETGYSAILADEGSPDRLYVGGGAGRILRHDCRCDYWTPTEADTKRVHALESNNKGERFLGAGGSGRVYRQADASDGAGWKVTTTNTGNALLAAAPSDGGSDVDVAVGKSGTIVEQ